MSVAVQGGGSIADDGEEEGVLGELGVGIESEGEQGAEEEGDARQSWEAPVLVRGLSVHGRGRHRGLGLA